MKNSIVNELIIAMKDRLPPGQNLANFLTDTLCIGREAVYRRLRGEVAFTIDEVAHISYKLGISIDQIIGNHLYNRVTFDMNLLRSANAIESYYEIIDRYLRIFDYVKGDKSTEVCTASNVLPFTLYSSFEYLSKFRLCRWLYHHGQIKTPNSLYEMAVEKQIINVHKKLSDSVKNCPKTSFVWDMNIFVSFVKEIQYFACLNLISKEDVLCLKEELYQLLTHMEALSITGEFSEGHKVFFYLSSIDFEATYTYIEKSDFQISMLRVYSINSMNSRDSKMCDYQKKWIHSLKRHSTLISQSGEIQRMMFFNEQKKIIDAL